MQAFRASRWMEAVAVSAGPLFGILIWEYFQIESDF